MTIEVKTKEPSPCLLKLELALCKGKKLYDKRDDMAKRDAKRDIERSMRARG